MMNQKRKKEIQQNVGQCLTALILVYDTLNFDTLYKCLAFLVFSFLRTQRLGRYEVS